MIRIMLYYLALGSNLGDRGKNLQAALFFLQNLGEVKSISSLYETRPVGMSGANDFYNLVLSLETALLPQALLAATKNFECNQGRDLQDSHYRPRIIDIDILLAEGTELQEPGLTIPHPRLCERAFVLVPLGEIAPRAVHPLKKKTVAQLLKELESLSGVRRISDISFAGFPATGSG